MRTIYKFHRSGLLNVLNPVFRFWSGLYNRFDRGMHPRQSVEDYLMAVREETVQLEEQLASHKEVRGQSQGRSYKCLSVSVSVLTLF